jgi:uncharacterized DUF497 family protein
MDFEYDPQKSELNKSAHGIDFEEAQIIWQDVEAIEVPLPFESEDRFMVIGLIDTKHWSAIVTYRAAAIRIISVRRSRKQEAELYDLSKRV